MMGEKIHNQKYAVIDIGSNTIRFVVYETISRHPYIYFNEKAQCKLGKFNKEGALSKSCKECAREALERFSTLIKTMDIKNVSAIATAALRDAIDGVSFAKELSDLLGINVDIISGLQEGYYAASGVLFGLYCAQGVVADLGGGSLELIEIDDKRTIHGGVTMPLGTIRLAEIVERTGIGEGFKNAIYEYLEENLQKIRYTQKTLYIVGGSWRALSLSYLNHTKYPINVLQGYEMNAKDLAKYCIELSKKNIKDLAQIPNISKRRLLSLPLSSILLACLIEKGNFEKVVVSITGVREGVYFASLPQYIQMQDPLISVATDVALLEARNCELGNAFYDWIYPIFKHLGIRKQRIIKAICLFSDMGWRHHPDYRAANIVRAILYGGWLGMTHLERITIANGVGFRYDSSFKLIDILSDFQKVQELDNDFQDYMTWSQSVGLAIRIGYLMCGFSIPLLQKCSLKIENNRLILELSADVKLSSDAVKKRVSHLAESLNIEYDIIIV